MLPQLGAIRTRSHSRVFAPSSAHAMKIEIVPSLLQVDSAAWNACANPSGNPYNPFISHEFLSALEISGSATRQTGWATRHLVLRDEAHQVLGVVPAYLKSHSMGEYVFDHAWADA